MPIWCFSASFALSRYRCVFGRPRPKNSSFKKIGPRHLGQQSLGRRTPASARPSTATGEPERGSRAPNQHFWAAPAANLRVSGLVLGLSLQFCALAGRRPRTATALLCAHAASAGVAWPRLEPQTFAQKNACLNHCAASSPGSVANLRVWGPRLPADGPERQRKSPNEA